MLELGGAVGFGNDGTGVASLSIIILKAANSFLILINSSLNDSSVTFSSFWVPNPKLLTSFNVLGCEDAITTF